MTKQKIRIYCIIAFIIIPLIIIIPGLIEFIKLQISFYTDTKPDYNALYPEAQTGHLFHDFYVKDDEYVYSIYALEFDSETNVKRIAFRASTEEEIKQTIHQSYIENMKTAYWEGDSVIMDFTESEEYKNFCKTHYNYSTIDNATIEEAYSNVPVYDLSSYIGEVEEEENIIVKIFMTLFNWAASAITLLRILIPLIIELIIALILKLTIFKIKKDKINESM